MPTSFVVCNDDLHFELYSIGALLCACELLKSLNLIRIDLNLIVDLKILSPFFLSLI